MPVYSARHGRTSFGSKKKNSAMSASSDEIPRRSRLARSSTFSLGRLPSPPQQPWLSLTDIFRPIVRCSTSHDVRRAFSSSSFAPRFTSASRVNAVAPTGARRIHTHLWKSAAWHRQLRLPDRTCLIMHSCCICPRLYRGTLSRQRIHCWSARRPPRLAVHAASTMVTVTRLPMCRRASSMVSAFVGWSGFNMRRTEPSATPSSLASCRCEMPAWRYAS